MQLPDYFLADLPPEAECTPGMLADACRALRLNREHYLAPRTTGDLIDLLSQVAANWLEPSDPFRRLALERAPAETGFSQPTLRRGLDHFFKAVSPDTLRALVEQDLGHLDRLDRFVASEVEHPSRRLALASGPELLVHLAAGNLPLPALMSLILGLLVRSAQFMKCASGSSLLPRLFAHSIYALEPKLGACLEIATWPRGHPTLEAALFAHADAITATGSDEMLADLRPRLPPHTRLLAYGHRVSFAFLAHEVLSRFEAKALAARAAADVAAWDQLGCLSPHVVYLEAGGAVGAPQFAEMLAAELDRLESTEPRAPLDPQSAADLAARRSLYEIRAAHSLDTRIWSSPNSTAWTVVYEADPQFRLSCLNRFVYVKPVPNLTEALHAALEVEGRVSTVALAALGDKARQLALALARWGVTRICPLGHMQQPSLLWRHDGRPSLAELVTFTDWES